MTGKEPDKQVYRILADTDSVAVSKGQGSIWNTGWVSSEKSLVTYGGQVLQPFTRYFWRVDIADKDKQKQAATRVASFETGIMDSKNWKGAWIADAADKDVKPVTIPANSTATVILASSSKMHAYLKGKLVAGNSIKLQSGKYEFLWK